MIIFPRAPTASESDQRRLFLRLSRIKRLIHSSLDRWNQRASTSCSQRVAANGSQEVADAPDAVDVDTGGDATLEAGPSGDLAIADVYGISANAEKKSKGKVHTFFSGMVGTIPGQLKDGWGQGIKSGNEWLAPWPGGEFPSHSKPSTSQRATDTEMNSKSTTVHWRKSKEHSIYDIEQDIKHQNVFWTNRPSLSASSSPPAAAFIHQTPPHDILPMLVQHPALRSAASRHSKAQREAWTALYAPQGASQVLGNEVESAYLRDWLQALSIGTSDPANSGSSNKCKVFRKVNRSKALDGWIVDDLGLYGDADEEEPEGEYEDFYEPPLRLGERPLSYPPLEDRLAGCMLLSGSTGTGKSAAVYAVARELGWEVFEVDAGMGKRSGAGLLGWIGDVGKNHLVSKGRSEVLPRIPEPKTNGGGAIGSFFANGLGKKVKTKTASQGSTHDPIEVDEVFRNRESLNGDACNPIPNKATGPTSELSRQNGHRRGQSGDYRQSLILIEEADILFTEENTFWPTIISLISESRRPVVLTCNGMSVPTPFNFLHPLLISSIRDFPDPDRSIASPSGPTFSASAVIPCDPIPRENSPKPRYR